VSVGRTHGDNNQEGRLVPAYSEWGQELAAGEGQLIDQPMPIGRHVSGLPSYGGTVGGLTVVAASIKPVVAPPGYFGDAPQRLQESVSAPDPWNRP
jgi:hypothetical protein